ncbi:hypothetical protein [Parvularcula sp. LCG005]|uniref:hypothetical protein n=1 Tax=Parvularcula sp. LCG005 TaxID=3078805 RepID=UPI002943A9E5|nr:hypothetical protein [Parvularcula sp. LCG005]WOI54415.1 hypothetical protein RUI03_05285 [Parvularcula sp. LCG005]
MMRTMFGCLICVGAIFVFALGLAAPLTPSVGYPSIDALAIFVKLPMAMLSGAFVMLKGLWRLFPSVVCVLLLLSLARISYSYSDEHSRTFSPR